MKSLSLSKPHLIIMVGIPGSGKSFFAEHFADTFKAPIVSFHRFRQELFNSPTFSKNEEDIISQVANYMLDEIFKTGRTIVYEGRTNTRAERTLLAKKTREAGYEPLFVWVQTEPLTAKKRATKHNTDRLAMNEAQYNTELKRFSIPHPTEKVIVISGKHTYASQLKIVLKRLVEPRIQTNEQINHVVRSPISRNFLIR